MTLQRRVLSVAYIDGTQASYPIRPKVEMLFERTYKVGIGSAFAGAESATNLYRLAWEVVRSQNGAVMPVVEDWLDTVDTITVDIEDVPPFVGAQPAVLSPNSASPPESPQPSS